MVRFLAAATLGLLFTGCSPLAGTWLGEGMCENVDAEWQWELIFVLERGGVFDGVVGYVGDAEYRIESEAQETGATYNLELTFYAALNVRDASYLGAQDVEVLGRFTGCDAEIDGKDYRPEDIGISECDSNANPFGGWDFRRDGPDSLEFEADHCAGELDRG